MHLHTRIDEIPPRDVVEEVVRKAISERVKHEEAVARAALTLGCSYATIREDAFDIEGESLRVSFTTVLLPWRRVVEHLDFPTFESYDIWIARNQP